MGEKKKKKKRTINYNQARQQTIEQSFWSRQRSQGEAKCKKRQGKQKDQQAEIQGKQNKWESRGKEGSRQA